VLIKLLIPLNRLEASVCKASTATLTDLSSLRLAAATTWSIMLKGEYWGAMTPAPTVRGCWFCACGCEMNRKINKDESPMRLALTDPFQAIPSPDRRLARCPDLQSSLYKGVWTPLHQPSDEPRRQGVVRIDLEHLVQDGEVVLKVCT
jgi:hypothetical protein